MARGEHAKLMPSAAHRWMTCPGSVAMVEAAPERVTQFNTQGTVCHSLFASYLRSRDALALHGEVGTLIEVDGLLVEVTQEMVEWVLEAARWVELALVANPETVMHVEERVIVGAAFGCPDALWGTPDIVLARPDLLTVVDAKFGWVDVEIRANPQISLYTIGKAHDYGWKHEMYELAILQPRSTPPVSIEMLTRAELEDRRDSYRSKIAAALRPAAPLVASDECAGCDAAGMCPEYQEWSRQRATLALRPPETIAPEALARILEAAPRIRNALVAAERYALQRLELGEPVPGWKRIRTKAHRKWANPEEAERVLSLVAEPEPFYTRRELVSPAQAEKALKLPTHALDSLAPAPEGAPVLVPEDDPRPALLPVFTEGDDNG